MSGEIRTEAADGPVARALFEQYIALVRARVGAQFVPVERIFASEEAFTGAGAGFLVAYDAAGEPVGCGALRALGDGPGIGEIKRMFVVGRARGAGHGRRLLQALERLAAEHGHRAVRVLTTEVLSEACALYEAEGYEPIERIERAGEPVEIWMEKALPSPP